MAMPLSYLKTAHTFLGIFFAPLLLLFVLTGGWQTVGPGEQDEDEAGKFALLMGKLSRVHTDGYYPPQGQGPHSETVFKALVVGLCLALIVSILSGLILAWKYNRRKWPVLLTLALGIAIPIGILYLK